MVIIYIDNLGGHFGYFYFFYSGRGKGESEVPGGGGGDRFFFWKSQEGGGVLQDGRGREGVCGELVNVLGGGAKYFFLFGAEMSTK